MGRAGTVLPWCWRHSPFWLMQSLFLAPEMPVCVCVCVCLLECSEPHTEVLSLCRFCRCDISAHTAHLLQSLFLLSQLVFGTAVLTLEESAKHAAAREAWGSQSVQISLEPAGQAMIARPTSERRSQVLAS